jgi:hypothetical protein
MLSPLSYLFGWYPRAKCVLHIALYSPSCTCRQAICGWVIFQLELGPHYQVDNVLVDTIGPVVVYDPDVLYKMISLSRVLDPTR